MGGTIGPGNRPGTQLTGKDKMQMKKNKQDGIVHAQRVEGGEIKKVHPADIKKSSGDRVD
mgnify:CR=1 FL=1|jgi:hypothetical protein